MLRIVLPETFDYDKNENRSNFSCLARTFPCVGALKDGKNKSNKSTLVSEDFNFKIISITETKSQL